MTLFIGIILVIASLGTFVFAGNIGTDDAEYGAMGSFLSFILFTIGVVVIHVGKPTALDVYKGKTTLQITYKNNVPIDSTVVYR